MPLSVGLTLIAETTGARLVSVDVAGGVLLAPPPFAASAPAAAAPPAAGSSHFNLPPRDDAPLAAPVRPVGAGLGFCSIVVVSTVPAGAAGAGPDSGCAGAAKRYSLSRIVATSRPKTQAIFFDAPLVTLGPMSPDTLAAAIGVGTPVALTTWSAMVNTASESSETRS